MKDEKIIKLLKKRDEKGIFAVSDKYEPLLYYIISTILGSRSQDIEECVNDVYYKIWANIDKYDLNKASLKTYLKVIARNTALNRIRDISRNEIYIYKEGLSSLLEEYADYCHNPEKKALDKEKIDVLQTILKNLGDRDRELFIRRYFYIQSSKDISEIMEMSVNAIDSRLSRLRGKIKQEYERRELYE